MRTIAARIPAPLYRLRACRPACTRALVPMPAINDRIDLSEVEKGIFDALLQANKEVSAMHIGPICHMSRLS
jgi:hypothetical protein